ncbi:MAG: Fis family transcriptional regulator [Paraburkholderia tropica]|uniref:Fis family transcriptional regulator n=1 Tax=Paraburkholderia TaxID=1822464 RepID=UPI0019801879|nr:Fis family transcriptional regulator [Paraburkholderia sp. Ac-20347]MBN3808773.1 Fis family transcriptional regulator [Paraburkholderia sp. Ac-20347]
MTKARGKPKPNLVKRSRQDARLYLPLDVATVNHISLRFRAALEMARSGRADRSTAHCLAHATLLASFVAEAGHGKLAPETLAAAERGLGELLRNGAETGAHDFAPELIELVTAVVNEHDRQLREVRMGVIVEATDRLDRRIAATRSNGELFRLD